ncbi:MAG: hypothetical protein JW870_19480 [Candidatus Delongbacteria bacterium]|nr:hypothetical protein [Candidatus Delongbacteria bacterium]
MAKHVVDFQGEVYCKVIDMKVSVVFGHYLYDDGSTKGFAKVLCPNFYISSYNNYNKCSENRKICGVAEGAKY